MALSQNGLFSKTKEAVEKYKTAQQDEEEALKELEKQLGDKNSNKPTVSPSTPTEPTPTEPTPSPKPEDEGPNGKKLIKTIDEFAESNEEVEDSLGNPVVIPKGFKFAGNDSDTVKEGIVIQDGEGNEFVWIPVSNIDGDNDKDTTNNQNEKDLISIDGSNKVEITLGRYTFDASNGTPHLEQRGSECGESNHVISTYYTEYVSQVRANGGVGAKDLQGFVDSVKKNHGYYIARYEAGSGTEGKPVSKSGTVWTDKTQLNASVAAQKMYTDTELTSDLVNSYAWDTAIVYIQAMGETNYANQKATTAMLQNTGMAGDNDVRCNIYDMAGNVLEWTTEYSTYTASPDKLPCVARGSYYSNSTYCTANRSYRLTYNRSYGYIGFRPLLYLK